MATTLISRLYYDHARPSAVSNLPKLRAAAAVRSEVTPQSTEYIRAWLEKQDAYKLHRPVRKRFTRNPYTVTKVMDVYECG